MSDIDKALRRTMDELRRKPNLKDTTAISATLMSQMRTFSDEIKADSELVGQKSKLERLARKIPDLRAQLQEAEEAEEALQRIKEISRDLSARKATFTKIQRDLDDMRKDMAA